MTGGGGISVQLLFDMAAEHNIPANNYYTRWHELAEWQLSMLRKYGMRPEHRLLDIGCGALRLGHLAIPYLQDGHYCGIDLDATHMRMGEALLQRLGIEKRYRLVVSGDFEFGKFGVTFDYAMAQSVITHLSIAQTERLMDNLARVMNPGGRFIFTYLPRAKQRTAGFLYRGIIPMKRGAFPGPGEFERLASRIGARFEVLPDAHQSQHVGMYRF